MTVSTGGSGLDRKNQRPFRKEKLQMLNLLKELHKNESGQDIIEYVFIAAAISVAGFLIIPGIATKVNSYWSSLNSSLK
jgi:Flp pilus assembly pilin Flp